MTHFAAQHIDGGLVLTVTDYAGGYPGHNYRLVIRDQWGHDIISFPRRPTWRAP
jgi:hypothetical protein